MSTHPKFSPRSNSRDSPPKTPLPKTPRILPAHLKYAREMKRGFGKELRVYFTPSFQGVMNVNDIWRSIVSCGDPTQSFIEVERERAEIIVDFEKDGLVSFFTNNPYAAKYNVDRLRHTVPPRLDQVAHVLRGIARWNYFFRRRNNAASFLQSVNIEFYRIEADKKTGKTNFVGRNLNRSGRIDIPADPKESYSMYISNESDHELYPYLLYFDIREQSIGLNSFFGVFLGIISTFFIITEPYFLPPMDEETSTEEPLPARTSCTIGCTSDGLPPFVFALGEGESADIGFFKLYLTRSPIDISQIFQDSPFQDLKSNVSARALNHPRSRLNLDYLETNNEDWGTVSIAVVQRVQEVESHRKNTLRPSWQVNLPAQALASQGQPYQTHSPFPSRLPPILPKSTSLPTIFSSAEDLAFEPPKFVMSNAPSPHERGVREKEKEKTRSNGHAQQRQRKDSSVPPNHHSSITRARKESTIPSPLKNAVSETIPSSRTPPPPQNPFSSSSPSLNEYVQSPQIGNNVNAIPNLFNSNNPLNGSVQSLPQGSVHSGTKLGGGKSSAAKILNAFKMFKKKQ